MSCSSYYGKVKVSERSMVKRIEDNWRQLVSKSTKTSDTQSKKYILAMFPYPSGNLHMGHVRVYTISDCIARFYSLLGNEVCHPIGWDAFGLPAENAAIERNENPFVWTEKNIETMRQQLSALGCRFNWDKELNTCSTSYYRWTQLLFLKLHHAGLAYQKESYVNWDPVDKTVLAQEQIDSNGRSWRSGAVVEKRLLRQWFVKASRFSKDLLDGLDDLVDWHDIVDIQRDWIGQCDVYKFQLPLVDCNRNEFDDVIDILLIDPSQLSTALFIAVRSSHVLNQQKYWDDIRHAGETQLQLYAVNPINNCRLPIVVTDNAPYLDDNMDVYLGSDSDSDKLLAECFNFKFDRSAQNKARSSLDIIETAKKDGWGGYLCSRKLGDWVLSRQRYWGTPIPIIYCAKCKAVPVPEADLPVMLPPYSAISKQTEVGGSPLESADDWLKVKCPKCNGDARRETDTMDTFFDSSWYFFRFLDAQNDKEMFDREKVKDWMPVDVYVGGKEHAVLHLYYARLIAHFLHSIGQSPVREPFLRLLPQGMIMGKAYQIVSSGQYVSEDRVQTVEGKLQDRQTGEAIVDSWEKMSKSKYNGVSPQDVLEQYGTDVTRLLVMSSSAPQSHRNWDTGPAKGICHWLDRLAWVVNAYVVQRKSGGVSDVVCCPEQSETERQLRQDYNYNVRMVSFLVHELHLLNAAIARLMAFTSLLRKCSAETMRNSSEFERAIHDLVIMLSIFAPHMASEFWSALSTCAASPARKWRKDKAVWEQQWPEPDADAEYCLEICIGEIPQKKLLIDRRRLQAISLQEAFDMASQIESINDAIKKKQLQPKSLRHMKYFGARLYLTSNKRFGQQVTN